MLQRVLKRVNAFLSEAHEILGVHEAAPSRIVLLNNTYEKLGRFSFAQDELLRQSLRCVENELYRASHVLAWTALIDLIDNVLASDEFKKLNSVRDKWKIESVDDLRENCSEFQIVDVCGTLKITNKGETRVLHGLLGKRNLCAHPSDFFPDYNQTLGYIADILDMMEKMRNKPY